jgi:hypothetical protein
MLQEDGTTGSLPCTTFRRVWLRGLATAGGESYFGAIVIPYVMLFFGATGGMIGVASLAGKKWTMVTALSFLIMFVLAFIQRQITGM